jgi:hypothetical protein
LIKILFLSNKNYKKIKLKIKYMKVTKRDGTKENYSI